VRALEDTVRTARFVYRLFVSSYRIVSYKRSLALFWLLCVALVWLFLKIEGQFFFHEQICIYF